MRTPKGAAIVVIALSAVWAAGCLLPTGHVDLDAPRWCPSAGPGVVGCEGGGGGPFEAGSPSAPGTLNAAMNATMTVTAYRGDGSVAATWRGSARWLGQLPASGAMFTGAVNRGGSPLGSGRRSSWVDEPTAAQSPRGGRVPGPDGADGGSPAGTGQPGDRGLSVGTPVFGGVISVPPSIAPALDVAAILSEAGAGPEALASVWLGRALRLGVPRLRHEIAKEAAEHATRAVDAARRRLSRSMDPRLLPPAEQRQIIDLMDDAVRREYLARVENGIAREIADIEQTLALSRELPRVEARRYNEKLLRENLEAAQRVQDATRQARADLSSAPVPTPTRPSASAAGSLLESFDDVVVNPKALYGKNADEVADILGEGWVRGRYGKTGTGWKFTNGDKIIFYHEGGRHAGPYYGYASGATGKVKIVGPGYEPLPGDKATIIPVDQ